MSQAEAVAKALGNARRSGRGWMVCCPAHDDYTPSLSLADGDSGQLLVKCFGGCDARAVLAALRQRGVTTSQPPTLARSTAKSPIPFDWSRKADAIFSSSVQMCGTPAERYLRARGCALPETDEVRYLPPRGSGYPAVLSRITDAVTANPISLHFTFIEHDGSCKAPIEKPKILLSGHRKAGGVIRLVDGAEVTYGLGVAEGLETALSVMHSGWRPVWAAVDAGNMAAFPVLTGIECLTIFADHDRAGLEAAQKCGARWRAAGRSARIVTPQTEGADWND